MEDRQIILVNTWKWPVSLYMYSRLLCTISKNIKVLDLTDEIIGNGVIKNIKSFLLTYTGINILHRLEDTDDIIHYIDPALAPLNNGNTNIVTIWDNPSLVLNTDLYMNSYLMKLHFKGNINRFSKFENVITPTNYIKQSLEDYGFEGKIKAIYTPVREIFQQMPDKNEIRKSLGLPLDKILILSISVDIKRKNLHIVKEISQILEGRFKIVRVGVPINDSITFNKVDDETLVKIYSACDMLLMPSLAEGQGLPVSEAFKVGLPVVASDIEVFREVADKAAIFVDPNSRKSIINGIKEAISAKEELTKAGLLRSELFSVSHFKQKMLEYYQSVSNQM